MRTQPLRRHAPGPDHPDGVAHSAADRVRDRADVTATLILLVVAPDLTSIEMVNAGHLPTLIVNDGTAGYVDSDNLLLGLAGPPPVSTVLPFHPGDSLVLVTDGLIERRGQSLSDALGDLKSVAAGAAESAEHLADLLVDHFNVGSAEDDVAIVILRRADGLATAETADGEATTP